jgi:hypothetical protein
MENEIRVCVESNGLIFSKKIVGKSVGTGSENWKLNGGFFLYKVSSHKKLMSIYFPIYKIVDM